MTGTEYEIASRRRESSRVRVKERTCLSHEWSRLEQVTFDYQHTAGFWQTQRREIYHRGHGAAVLLYNVSLRTIVLVRQFRFPDWDCGGEGFLLEVPAGIIEAENPAETIRKETHEETGFIIEKPEFLFKAYVSPGSITEQLHYFCASYEPGKRLGEGGGLTEEGEDIEVVEVRIDEAVAWIRDGKIVDAKTIILLQYAQLHVFGT